MTDEWIDHGQPAELTELTDWWTRAGEKSP
jgi:hypothetical protein